MEERKQEVIKSIDSQGKLTDEIVEALENAKTLSEVEDIYRPYKQKKKTRATVAKAKGLDPLAQIIFEQQDKRNIEEIAKEFVDEEKGVYNKEDGSLNLNPNSLKIIKDAYVEPSFADAKAYDSFQFVRNGYFCIDSKDSTPENLVFNRIVSLKSSFKLPKK